ncbi:MAG: glucose-6-phosphate isomerase, archaeal [Archaeoglobi archaeon]|nr:glucose-6-phosphate isomerase [Candidatus Mnemosynella bozhongmuii]MDI3502858.1 glucose-6-phosphate isomerase, archaeal [Archaeoglobi archaeon]MDK2781681.1 glucose-6-phosphate isomerase, archaeal [Archaeoglobi archaeon]
MELEIGGRRIRGVPRYLDEMREVLFDEEYAKKAENEPLYYMCRDICLSRRDMETLRNFRVRYDITIIPPKSLGVEFVKTKGHYHPEVKRGLSYPELYEVLEGEAIFLLQKNEEGKITDVVFVEASEGDKVMIPPNYGHVTINPSKKILKLANIVSRDFSSVYEPYERMRGACYYRIFDGWIRNERYAEIPELREGEKWREMKRRKEIYSLIRDEDEILRIFNDPEEWEWEI